MAHRFPLSIGQGGFTVSSDIDFFRNSSIDWPSVFAIVRSSLSLNSTCKDRQQFAHWVQSMRAKYFRLNVLTRLSMLRGACCFNHDRNSQFSSSCSCESCWILDRSISVFITLRCFRGGILTSRRLPAKRLHNNTRLHDHKRNYLKPRHGENRGGNMCVAYQPFERI